MASWVGDLRPRFADVRRIAVLRGSGLGDLVQALPAVEALRAAYPGAEVTLLGTPAHRALLAGRPSPFAALEVLPLRPGVRDGGPEDRAATAAFLAQMRGRAFDLAVQLHGGGRNSNPFLLELGARHTIGTRTDDAPALERTRPYLYYQHEIARTLEVVALAGAAPVQLEPRLPLLPEERARRRARSPERPTVVLHPGATDPRRRWPAACFGTVAEALARDGARVVVVGDEVDVPAAEQVVAVVRRSGGQASSRAGRESLPELVQTLLDADVVVANDSGPRHVAAALGLATVGVYWVGNVVNAGPLGRSRHRIQVSFTVGLPGLRRGHHPGGLDRRALPARRLDRRGRAAGPGAGRRPGPARRRPPGAPASRAVRPRQEDSMDRWGEADGRPEVLVLRALKLGDLLVSVPALRGIRRARPDARLVLAMPAWLEPVIELVDAVDVLLPTAGLDDLLPVPQGRVETAVDLHGHGPASRRLCEALEPQRLVGWRAPGWDGPEWPEDVHERVRWAGLVTAHGMPADPDDLAIRRPLVPSPRPGCAVVHVGAYYGSREWPVERFAAVAVGLAARGADVVLTGGDADRARAERTAALAGLPASAVLAGRLALEEFAAVIADAALVVTADTGAGHLASAYARPSVVIFGPVPPAHWGPPPGPHVALTHAELRRGEPFVDEPDPALLGVTVEEVLAAVDTLPVSFRRRPAS